MEMMVIEGKRHGQPKEWPTDEYTANGVLIVPGLKVRDHNYHTTMVTDRMPDYSHDVAWFRTANGEDFDGSRLVAVAF